MWRNKLHFKALQIRQLKVLFLSMVFNLTTQWVLFHVRLSIGWRLKIVCCRKNHGEQTGVMDELIL